VANPKIKSKQPVVNRQKVQAKKNTRRMKINPRFIRRVMKIKLLNVRPYLLYLVYG
jgi:hypothetical protein